MSRSNRVRTQSTASPPGEWLTLAEARAILQVTSEDVVRAWAQKYGVLRSSLKPDGSLVVRTDDVLHQKAARDAHWAVGGDELTEEELETLRKARPGTYPWARERKQPSAA